MTRAARAACERVPVYDAVVTLGRRHEARILSCIEKELAVAVRVAQLLLEEINESSSDPGCQFASNRGSDSISMKLLGGLVLFPRRNQHHASQISDFVACPERARCRRRELRRRSDRGHRPGRSQHRRLPFMRSCVAARSQPLYPAGVGSALFRSKDSPSRCHAPVCLQRAPLPAQDLRRTLR